MLSMNGPALNVTVGAAGLVLILVCVLSLRYRDALFRAIQRNERRRFGDLDYERLTRRATMLTMVIAPAILGIVMGVFVIVVAISSYSRSA
jgi:hypothetical protein